MSSALKASARRVQEALAARGFAFDVRQFPESTRTSAEAAAASSSASPTRPTGPTGAKLKMTDIIGQYGLEG